MEAARADAWANPSSTHRAGRAARAHLERARDRVAAALGGAPAEVVLTAGGTEACNLAMFGLLHDRGHILVGAAEHPAIAEAANRLGGHGYEVQTLACPGGLGPTPAELEASLRPDTRLVALQWVNHETGNVFDAHAYAEVCTRAGVPFVVDASQALGKVPVDVGSLGATAVVVASAKVGGPAGAAALWLQRQCSLEPLLAGGGQERGRRPGTPDVAAAAGFGAAAERAPERLRAQPQVGVLRDRLQQFLVERGAVVNGDAAPRVATACNVSLRGWSGPELVAALDLEGLCASAGAACSSGLSEPSPVLLAMYPEQSWRASSALRLTLGPETSADQVDQALGILDRVLSRART